MGSHAKPRTTGRKATLGALALGATLSGVGLIAAALDPATAVLTANGADDGNAAQLSGLSSPVSLDLTPAADSITDLSSAPLPPPDASAATGTARQGPAQQHVTADATVSSVIRTVTSTVSAKRTSGASGSTQTTATPTAASATSQTSGSASGYAGKHKAAGSGTAPTATSAITSAVEKAVSPITSTTSQVLPAVHSLVSQVPVVSTLVQDTGAGGTVGSLPLVGSLLGGSGDGQSVVTVPGISSLSGLV